MLEFTLFILILVANGAPILAHKFLPGVPACPVDGGVKLPDGKPLFGESKTVRGLLAALFSTVLAGMILQVPVAISLMIATVSMFGDLLSSFVKRRLGRAPGAMFLGLDQIPESLLPLLAVKSRIGLEWDSILMIVAGFVVVELLLSRLLYRLHVRKHPY